MPTKTSDFITLFNTIWYRDFPVALGTFQIAKRADWTTHIATTVRQVSGFMGLFSCFESGGRTDAEIKLANGKVWAKLEWEWDEPREERVGELDKLAAAASGCELCVFIGYSRNDRLEENLEKIRAAWVGAGKPLVAILVTFDAEGNTRAFDRLQTYSFDGTGVSLVRHQPALPWCVSGSRWEALEG